MVNATIKADDLDFSSALNVISSAQKFVIPVPAFPAGGEPLVFPEGTVKDGASIAGQPIVDYKGRPIGDAGIVFFNGKDKAWQAAPGNGSSVVIINQVSEDQAQKLDGFIRTQFAHRPNLGLSVNELKMVLDYARNDLGLGDMYNSDKAFISGKMSRVGNDTGIEAYGLHKRDDRDICQAVYLRGEGEFQGPAATPQKFDNGAVIVRQGDSVRLVQPEVFVDTYRKADGAKVDLTDIPGFYKHLEAAAVDFTDAPIYRKTSTLAKGNVEFSVGAQQVVTMIDGKVETTNNANDGDAIVTGPKGERYVLGNRAKFDRLYEQDPDNEGQYRSKNVIRAVQVTEPVQIMAPWGEIQKTLAGRVAQSVADAKDIYLIEEGAFQATYSPETAAARPGAGVKEAARPKNG